jgi:hypothetical protein
MVDAVNISTEAHLEAAQCVEIIAGDLTVTDTQLTTIMLPNLRSVGGEISIRDNRMLDAVLFPELVSVEERLIVELLFSGDRVEMPKLETVGGDLHMNLDRQSTLVLTSLRSAGGLRLPGAVLDTLSLPALESVAGDFGLPLAFRLTSLSAPLLATVGNLYLTGTQLTDLDGLPTLGRITGNLTITDNQSLPTCAAEALRDRIQAAGGIGGFVQIQANDDSGTCP